MIYDNTGSDDTPPRVGRLTLEDALEIRREERETRAGEGPPGEHPAREELRGIVGSGGLLRASPEMADHISLCPQCLTEWSAAVRAHAEAGEPRGAPELDYGLLEAAATHDPVGARELRSTSGSYMLALSPNVDDRSRGLITFKVHEALAPSLEGRCVTVYTGEALLDGEVTNDYLYLERQCEDLAAIDLSRGWTVVVAESDT